MAAFIALPSFLSLCLGINNIAIKDVALASFDEVAVESEALTELEQQAQQITEIISITQGDEVLGAENFKQTPLARQDIERDDKGFPRYLVESNAKAEIAKSTNLTGEESLINVITVVGMVSISAKSSATFNYVTAQINSYSNENSYLQVDGTKKEPSRLKNMSTITSVSLVAPNSNAININKVTLVFNDTTGEPEAYEDHCYEFFIMQINTLRLDNGLIKWENQGNDIYTPGQGQTYSQSLVLTLDDNILANWLNELCVEFWHNGKAYKLIFTKINGVDCVLNYCGSNSNADYYYYQGKYYSALEYQSFMNMLNISDQEKSLMRDNALAFKAITLDPARTLTFNQSGEYKVRIYDASSVLTFPTSFALDLESVDEYAYANFFEYNFTIENINYLNGFYYTAVAKEHPLNANGEEITNKYTNKYVVAAEERRDSDFDSSNLEVQSVNNAVTLSFYNIDSNFIKEIYYDKYSIDGNNVLAQKQNISSQSLTLTEEGTYYVFIKFKVDLATQGPILASSNSVIRIAFQILSGIRQSYRFNDEDYPKQTDNLDNNVVKTYNLSQTYTSSFGGIYGESESIFKLQIAKSNPTITGIANQKTTNEAVTINISGVATSELGAQIRVTRDGNVIRDVVVTNKNEDRALSYTLTYGDSDLGTYVVTITDAMNNTNRLQFTIAKQQNAAGIILIIVGVVIGAAALIFIIRARSKVTVR